MTSRSKLISNTSKQLRHADDSAAALLVKLLDGSQGRNFDIESLFVERLTDNSWRWVIYEFLRAKTIEPKVSHPNYYWHKNKRKFLSLWAVVHTLRKAGDQADLILVNYADDESKGIKEMLVIDIDVNSTEVIRTASQKNGVASPEVRRHVITQDVFMSFEDFKRKFCDFNNNKKGDTWEILESRLIPRTVEPITESFTASNTAIPTCPGCGKLFTPRKPDALLCIECWRKNR